MATKLDDLREEQAEIDPDLLDDLDRESKEFDKDSEIDRILKTFKLDAYAVLDLQPGVPESDIKKCYRTKSLLIHPDKTTNASAPDAFDRLKKAQLTLLDEKERARLDESIADARMLLMRERKLDKDSAEVKEPNAEFRRAWREKAKDVLIDDELRRRRQVKGQMRDEGRQQKRDDEEAAERKRKREYADAWEATREGRIGSWRDFQKKGGVVGGGAVGAGVKKKKKVKVQTLA